MSAIPETTTANNPDAPKGKVVAFAPTPQAENSLPVGHEGRVVKHPAAQTTMRVHKEEANANGKSKAELVAEIYEAANKAKEVARITQQRALQRNPRAKVRSIMEIDSQIMNHAHAAVDAINQATNNCPPNAALPAQLQNFRFQLPQHLHTEVHDHEAHGHHDDDKEHQPKLKAHAEKQAGNNALSAPYLTAEQYQYLLVMGALAAGAGLAASGSLSIENASPVSFSQANPDTLPEGYWVKKCCNGDQVKKFTEMLEKQREEAALHPHEHGV